MVSSSRLNFIRKYLNRTKSYTSTRFIIELSFLAVLGKILIAFFIGVLIYANDINASKLPTPGYQKISSPILLFFLLCILGPVIETIIGQWLPITLIKKITSNTNLVMWIDVMLFTFAHYWSYGFIQSFFVLPSAIVLAWSFILHSDDSFLKAFWITTSIHAVYNIVAFLPLAFK